MLRISWDTERFCQSNQSHGREAELLPALARALCQACLGEAQAVTAARAETKGSSPAIVAALHRAASNLFEAAAQELKPRTAEYSEQLRKFLALSSELHQARARKAAAAMQSADGHPGVALSDLQVQHHW